MCADIIGHARINMQVNLSHAWFQVGVELYEHDDAVDAATGGLRRSCNWAMEGRNLAHRPAYAAKVKELAAVLRAGWRGALPPTPAR